MKKRKLFFLLTAIACMAMPLTACESEEESSQQQETTTYELTKYLAAEADSNDYSTVSRIDGSVVSYDRDHNLAVVETKELENNNEEKTRYKVYDLVSGEVLYETSVTNSLSKPYPYKELTVTVDYPVIRVVEDTTTQTVTSTEMDTDTTTRYSYYRAAKNSGALKTSLDEEASAVIASGNLYSIEIDGTMYWLNEDAEVVRKIDGTVADTYNIEFDFFKGEYNDYLYAWEFGEMYRRIQVFNTEGVCCAQYAFSNNAVNMSSLFGGEVAYILNNGNVFTQEVIKVEDGEEYDFSFLGVDCVVSSKIIDYKTGAVTEVDLDYLVMDLESAYGRTHRSDFPFVLAEGKQNQAMVTLFANGELTKNAYVVLDNDMKVEYTLKNVDDTIDVGTVGENWYGASLVIGGQEASRIYDYDGNVICTLPYNTEGIADGLILTNTAIYDWQMNLLYDLEASKFASNYGFDHFICEIEDGRIYLTTSNSLTGASDEAFVFDVATKEFVLLADGLDTKLQTEGLGGGLYGIRDKEMGTYSIYNAEGTLLVKMTASYVNVTSCEDVAYITTTIDGKPVCYVIQ